MPWISASTHWPSAKLASDQFESNPKRNKNTDIKCLYFYLVLGAWDSWNLLYL